jgi:hypothetical protein
MTDAKPQSTSTSRPTSRRRLLAISAAVPAAIAAANALPGWRIGASAPQAPPPTSPVGAASALAALPAPATPAYWFC